jgi:hypothetical protein
LYNILAKISDEDCHDMIFFPIVDPCLRRQDKERNGQPRYSLFFPLFSIYKTIFAFKNIFICLKIKGHDLFKILKGVQLAEFPHPLPWIAAEHEKASQELYVGYGGRHRKEAADLPWPAHGKERPSHLDHVRPHGSTHLLHARGRPPTLGETRD